MKRLFIVVLFSIFTFIACNDGSDIGGDDYDKKIEIVNQTGINWEDCIVGSFDSGSSEVNYTDPIGKPVPDGTSFEARVKGDCFDIVFYESGDIQHITREFSTSEDKVVVTKEDIRDR